MSRDKQIEDMAKDICHLGRKCPDCSRQAMCKAMNYASRFYAKGYRKTADVAEEIFAEIIEQVQRSADEAKLLAESENNPYIKTELRGEQIGALLALKIIVNSKKKYIGDSDNG